MDNFLLILAFCWFALVVIGALNFKKLRRKWAHVMGVFGSYVIFLGLMLAVNLLVSLVCLIAGNKEVFGAGVAEVIFMIIAMVICLGYMVTCILKCSTVKEKIMLPFAACMIAAGFIWRLLGSIIFHTPISDDSEETANEFDIRKLPNIIYDESNNRWQLQQHNGDSVIYHNDAGQEVTIYFGQISGSGAVTSAGNFHWY